MFLIFSNLSKAIWDFEDVGSEVCVMYSYGDTKYGGGVSFANFNNDFWDNITKATEEAELIYILVDNNGVVI